MGLFKSDLFWIGIAIVVAVTYFHHKPLTLPICVSLEIFSTPVCLPKMASS